MNKIHEDAEIVYLGGTVEERPSLHTHDAEPPR